MLRSLGAAASKHTEASLGAEIAMAEEDSNNLQPVKSRRAYQSSAAVTSCLYSEKTCWLNAFGGAIRALLYVQLRRDLLN